MDGNTNNNNALNQHLLHMVEQLQIVMKDQAFRADHQEGRTFEIRQVTKVFPLR